MKESLEILKQFILSSNRNTDKVWIAYQRILGELKCLNAEIISLKRELRMYIPEDMK